MVLSALDVILKLGWVVALPYVIVYSGWLIWREGVLRWLG